MVKKLLIAVCLLTASAQTGWGATAFTTFGPGDSYNTGAGWTIGNAVLQAEVAVSFVAGSDATLDSIRVATFFSEGLNDFIVSLTADDGGQPGTALETFSGLVFPGTSSILTLNSVTNPLLSSGSTYWVMMTAADLTASSGAWNLNDQGAIGVSLRSSLNAFTWTPSDTSPAVEVNVTDAAIPEPSTVILTLSGLAALGVLRGRRSSVA